MYEDDGGQFANGIGNHTFFGRTNQGLIRRTLIKFNLAELPSNATIDSVHLIIKANKTRGGSDPVTVHQVTSDWGVGTSDAASNEGRGIASTTYDITWIHTFFPNSSWSTAGGDFNSTALITATIQSPALYTLKGSDEFNTLISNWLSEEVENFGIIIRGDENTDQSAVRMNSLESQNDFALLRVFYEETGTSNEFSANKPQNFILGNNYPNPFNPSTKISYSIPSTSQIELVVYNQLGQQVQILVNNAIQSAGSYEVSFSTQNQLASGLY